MFREIRRVEVPPEVAFPGAKQFWSVKQVFIDKTGLEEIEQRVFITSLEIDQLSAEASLQLVRLHWGIENGGNWTADVILKEDTHSPCNTGYGRLVISWLRLLAYNLMSVVRIHLPKRDKQFVRWARAQDVIYLSLLKFDDIRVGAQPLPKA